MRRFATRHRPSHRARVTDPGGLRGGQLPPSLSDPSQRRRGRPAARCAASRRGSRNCVFDRRRLWVTSRHRRLDAPLSDIGSPIASCLSSPIPAPSTSVPPRSLSDPSRRRNGRHAARCAASRPKPRNLYLRSAQLQVDRPLRRRDAPLRDTERPDAAGTRSPDLGVRDNSRISARAQTGLHG